MNDKFLISAGPALGPRLLMVLSLGLSLGLASHQAAQAQPQSIPPSPELVPLCVGDFPPFNSAHLPQQGPVIEITTEAFKRSGYAVKTQFMPWARIVKEGEEKNCLILGIWRNAQRDQIFNFSLPIVQQELGFFVRQDSPIQDWRKPGLLQQELIGVERGSYLSPALQAPGVHLDPSGGIRTNLQKLVRERIHLAYAAKESGLYAIQNDEGLKHKVRWLPPAIERKDAFLACAKDHPEQARLLNAFDRGLRSCLLYTSPSPRD